MTALCVLQAMKINAKLGGVNVSLISKPVSWMNEPFMILGESLSKLHGWPPDITVLCSLHTALMEVS